MPEILLQPWVLTDLLKHHLSQKVLGIILCKIKSWGSQCSNKSLFCMEVFGRVREAAGARPCFEVLPYTSQ